MIRDVSDKILENLKSFRRLCLEGGMSPYGYKLKQIGCCIDMFLEEGSVKNTSGKYRDYKIWHIRLNTHSTVPLLIKIRTKRDIPII